MERQDPMGIGDEGLVRPESPDLNFGMAKAGEGSPKIGSRSHKKLSGAPKRFKSSFIFFSMEKHKQIKAQLQKERTVPKSTNITKMVSEAWRNLTPEDKGKYEDMAREDKARYDVERANFKEEKGSSIATKKKQKDPTAPRRPMSAFLAFANSRRAEVKAQNRDRSNGEISKILSGKWKDAPEPLKQKYRDEESAKWAAYRDSMIEWKKKNDGRKRASKALEAANALKSKKKKKIRKSKSKFFEEEPSIADNSFDDPHFGGFGGGGLDAVSNNPAGNQDDIMAASAALRGVRSGPNTHQFGGGATASGAGSMMGGAGGAGLMDSSMQQSLQQGGGGYGVLFGMNSMNTFGAGIPGSAGNSASGTGGFGQEMNNSSANRALLEMGFPYQQYSSYAGVLGNNSQAMLMAQAALRGNPGAYLGLSDQQPPLSQLASLAGGQNGSGALGQSQVSMGIGLGLGGMNGMGGLMNDNSSNGMINNALF